MARKLGKLAPVYDERTLKLATYLDTTKPFIAPPVTNRLAKISNVFPMYDNDKYGDCVPAGMGHAVQAWTDLVGAPVAVTDEQVLAAYHDIAGFDPATGANDNGCVELKALKYWNRHGIGGHKIAGYAAVNPRRMDLVRAANYLFDGLFLGVSLPVSAQDQPDVWTYEPDQGSAAYPGSWGGHCVFVVDHDQQGLTFISWGHIMRMTWEFWSRYTDESYAVFSDDALAAGKSIEGFAAAELAADLRRF